jgi:DNA-binding FadR family transcriptional regulator
MKPHSLHGPPSRNSQREREVLILRDGKLKVHAAVAREIGSRILRGDYLPGVLLPNEAEWCRIFQVSRSVVRESIKMLSAKGLVMSRPKIGTRIAPRERWNLLDPDVLAWYSVVPARQQFLESVQEIRYMIEPEAAALAALNRSPAQMAAISKALSDMANAKVLSTRIEADARFHMAILIAAGNEFLLPFGFLIESSLVALFDYVTRHIQNHRMADDLHGAIEKAIRERKPEVARRAVRRNLTNTDIVIRRAARATVRAPRPNAPRRPGKPVAAGRSRGSGRDRAPAAG